MRTEIKYKRQSARAPEKSQMVRNLNDFEYDWSWTGFLAQINGEIVTGVFAAITYHARWPCDLHS